MTLDYYSGFYDNIGGNLIEECTRRSSLVITNCLFADDAALICSSREDMLEYLRKSLQSLV